MRADLEKCCTNATELSEVRGVATAPHLSTVARSMESKMLLSAVIITGWLLASHGATVHPEISPLQ